MLLSFGRVLLFSLTKLSLATAVTLFFVSPFFITILSMIFLNETIGLRRWIALVIGFVGVILVMDPKINDFNIQTFKHNHGPIDVQTFRINNFAYSTDIKKFYNNDIDKLKNLDLWIVGLLKYETHPSHGGFEEIMEYINYLKSMIFL